MGNELGSFKEDDRVQVVDDAAVLQHCIEECEDLEWDDEMYLDTVGRIGIVVRLDEDGLVVVQFEGCDEEKYYPNQALESAVVVVASEGKSTPQEGPVRSPVLSMAQASIRSLNQISFRSPKLKVIQSSFGNESEAYATSRLIRVVFTMAFSGFLIGYTLRSYAATSDTVCFGRNSRTLMTAVEGRVADHVCWTAASIGAILAGVCARCGRKGTAVVGSSLFIFGQVMSSGSRNASTFVLGHLFTGLGLGVLSTIAPLYICEVSPDQRRAMFVTFFVAMAAVGHLTASVLALFFSDEACDGRGWRWLLGVVVVPAIAHLLLLFRLPETPVFLARNGRAEEARRLALLLHPGCEPSADDLAQPAAGDHRPASLADFCSRYRLPAATGLALFALQQLLSPVAFEAECRVPGTASILLNQFGSSDEPATLLEKNQAYAGASCLVAVHALCMVFAIQMTTRRRLLLVSTGGCAVSLVCLGLLQAAGAGAPAQVAALAAHYVLHTTGLNCVPSASSTSRRTTQCGWSFGSPLKPLPDQLFQVSTPLKSPECHITLNPLDFNFLSETPECQL
ncbi:putative inositol transporter 2 [Diplonema papillatum]|nr:putative inositol transporter 2 [Diplonema papillatum]